MFAVRQRIEDCLDVPRAMKEHGITGDAWRHSADAREENLAHRIQAHVTARDRAMAEPDDRRLAMMAAARDAATRLDSDSFARLSKRQQDSLRQVRETLRSGRNQERLREIRLKAQDPRHEIDPHLRSRDRFHHQ